MNNYITIQPIDEKIDFVNLAITLSNVNSKSREDMEVVCKDGNFNIKNLTSNIQIHSDTVNKIDESNIGQKKEGDALITNIPNTPLLIFTADCVPIAIIDKKNKAIGLAHAGWRGTYDAIPKDFVCIIGPSIGPCCYEVSKDLVEKFNMNFTNSTEKFYTIEEDKYKLDLWKVNEHILRECGVKDENIINLNLCTSCNSDKFHSYRKHNKTQERIGTILQIK